MNKKSTLPPLKTNVGLGLFSGRKPRSDIKVNVSLNSKVPKFPNILPMKQLKSDESEDFDPIPKILIEDSLSEQDNQQNNKFLGGMNNGPTLTQLQVITESKS